MSANDKIDWIENAKFLESAGEYAKIALEGSQGVKSVKKAEKLCRHNFLTKKVFEKLVYNEQLKQHEALHLYIACIISKANRIAGVKDFVIEWLKKEEFREDVLKCARYELRFSSGKRFVEDALQDRWIHFWDTNYFEQMGFVVKSKRHKARRALITAIVREANSMAGDDEEAEQEELRSKISVRNDSPKIPTSLSELFKWLKKKGVDQDILFFMYMYMTGFTYKQIHELVGWSLGKCSKFKTRSKNLIKQFFISMDIHVITKKKKKVKKKAKKKVKKTE